jgi:cation:H+ antiporter
MGASTGILITAPAFAWSAKWLAQASGLGNSYVGTWLVGLSTSLPEMAATLAAVRLGHLDLAVGNLFGSNAFNMALFFLMDLPGKGGFFAGLDPSHAETAFLGVALMALGLAVLAHRKGRRLGGAIILAAYFASAVFFAFSGVRHVQP